MSEQVPLDDQTLALAKGPNYAALTTLLPDGQPMTHVVWIDADDGLLLVNTEVDRQKYRNLRRDGRVSVAIIDAANPHHYAEVRGTVVDAVTGPDARTHVDALSQRYNGAPYANPITSERAIVKIRPERVRVQ